MPVQELGLLSTLVISLVAAFGCGLFARAAGLPPLLGYLMAGVLIGPFTPGMVANQTLANELAEIGVALLLFTIGLHFSFKDLLAVKKIVVPGALAQVSLSLLLGTTVSVFMLDLPVSSALVVSLAMVTASTAVVTRMLDERHQLVSMTGHLAIGWSVVQDLIVIFALVLLPTLGGRSDAGYMDIAGSLGKTVLQIAGFVAIMLLGGRRVIPWLLGYVARTKSRELFTLCVIVLALGIAYGSSVLFGVSLALGAFFAGIVIGESDLNHHAASEALSLQQVFTILFFVSVGMLFDPTSVIQMPRELIVYLLTIMIGTGFATFVLLLFFRIPLPTAALVGAAFTQIGEISFVLSQLGYNSGFYDGRVRDLIIAVALLSIIINPFVVKSVMWFVSWLIKQPFFVESFSKRQDLAMTSGDLATDHAIIVGRGRVGGIVANAFKELEIPHITIESDHTLAKRLRAQGDTVIFGDASRETVIEAASPKSARLMVIAIPDPQAAKQIVRSVRKNYPEIKIIVRTHSAEETKAMNRLGVGFAVMGEREIAFGMTYYALQARGYDVDHTKSTIGHLRQQIYDLDQASL